MGSLCFRCGKSSKTKQGCILVKNRPVHSDCFRCQVCNTELKLKDLIRLQDYVQEPQLFCQKHISEAFGQESCDENDKCSSVESAIGTDSSDTESIPSNGCKTLNRSYIDSVSGGSHSDDSESYSEIPLNLDELAQKPGFRTFEKNNHLVDNFLRAERESLRNPPNSPVSDITHFMETSIDNLDKEETDRYSAKFRPERSDLSTGPTVSFETSPEETLHKPVVASAEPMPLSIVALKRQLFEVLSSPVDSPSSSSSKRKPIRSSRSSRNKKLTSSRLRRESGRSFMMVDFTGDSDRCVDVLRVNGSIRFREEVKPEISLSHHISFFENQIRQQRCNEHLRKPRDADKSSEQTLENSKNAITENAPVKQGQTEKEKRGSLASTGSKTSCDSVGYVPSRVVCEPIRNTIEVIESAKQSRLSRSSYRELTDPRLNQNATNQASVRRSIDRIFENPYLSSGDIADQAMYHSSKRIIRDFLHKNSRGTVSVRENSYRFDGDCRHCKSLC